MKVSPKIYRKYVILSSKGKPLLYVRIKKMVYGLIWSALLFYKELLKYFNTYEFHINPYNPWIEKMS